MIGRIHIVLILILVICSCQNKEDQIPSEKNIEEIVRYVYTKDYYFEIFKKQDLPLNSDLVKLDIDFSGQSFSPWQNKARYNELLKIEIEGKKIFSSADSVYFRFQNSNLKSYSLDKNQFKDILYESKNPLMSHNTISIPIFSKSQDYAYVEVAHGGDGGGGYCVILEKVDGKWKILKQIGLWDS
jgi:hypothetical protein